MFSVSSLLLLVGIVVGAVDGLVVKVGVVVVADVVACCNQLRNCSSRRVRHLKANNCVGIETFARLLF